MLIRGVKLPNRALDQTDIETTKARAARSGRSHGGAPLRNGAGGRGRDFPNYAAPNSYSRPPNQSQQTYGGQNGYNSNPYTTPQTSSWQPPPPGVAGFARGPPPPPPNSYGSYAHSQYRHAQPAPAAYSAQYQHQTQPFGQNAAYDYRRNGSGGPDHGPPPGYGRY